MLKYVSAKKHIGVYLLIDNIKTIFEYNMWRWTTKLKGQIFEIEIYKLN